ncbi:MAG: Clp protease N-terminal domain-containing protein [Terriglobales bacterium]
MKLAGDEAGQRGSSEIGTEHIVLGLLRDATLVSSVMAGIAVEEIRNEVTAYVHPELAKSPRTDMPLGKQSKNALLCARREAQRLSHRNVNNYHLLLGLLQMEDCFAAQALKRRGVSLDYIRKQPTQLQKGGNEKDASQAASEAAAADSWPGDPHLRDMDSLAIELAFLEDYKGALKLVDEIFVEPSHDGRDRAIRNLASMGYAITLTLGDLDAAERYCEFSVTFDPESAIAHYELAYCLQKQGKNEEARKIAFRSYQLSKTQGGEIGEGLAEMIERKFPDIMPDK